MGEQAADLAAKVLPVRGRHQSEAEERAARMANNLRVIKEAADAETRGPEPTGDGFTLDELNNASNAFSPAEESPCGSGFVAAGEVSSPNADALAFLDQVNAV
jgi:hypothetical protein